MSISCLLYNNHFSHRILSLDILIWLYLAVLAMSISTINITKFKSLLYSQCCAKAYKEWRGPSPQLIAPVQHSSEETS